MAIDDAIDIAEENTLAPDQNGDGSSQDENGDLLSFLHKEFDPNGDLANDGDTKGDLNDFFDKFMENQLTFEQLAQEVRELEEQQRLEEEQDELRANIEDAFFAEINRILQEGKNFDLEDEAAENLVEAIMKDDPGEILQAHLDLYSGSATNVQRLLELANLTQQGLASGLVSGVSAGKSKIPGFFGSRNGHAGVANFAAQMSMQNAQQEQDPISFLPPGILISDFRSSLSSDINDLVDYGRWTLDAPNISDDQKAITTEQIIEKIKDNLKNDPAFQSLTDEQKNAVATALMAENNIDRGFFAPDEQDLYEAALKAERIRIKEFLEEAEKLKIENPEKYAELLEEFSNSVIAFQKTQNTNLQLQNGSKALALSDQMKETVVISLDYNYGKNTRFAVYVGTGISENGELITDGDGPLQYFMSTDDQTIEPIKLAYAIASEADQGAKLADQIENSGLKFSDLSKQTQQDLAEDQITDLEALLSELRTLDSSFFITGTIMNDDSFIQTVGRYALEQEIAEQQAKGQVFANELSLEEVAASMLNQEELLQQQIVTLQSLKEQRAQLEEELAGSEYAYFFDRQLKQLDADILTAEAEIEQFRTHFESEAENSAQSINDIYDNAQMQVGPDFLVIHDSEIFSPTSTPQNNIDVEIDRMNNAKEQADLAAAALGKPTSEDIANDPRNIQIKDYNQEADSGLRSAQFSGTSSVIKNFHPTNPLTGEEWTDREIYALKIQFELEAEVIGATRFDRAEFIDDKYQFINDRARNFPAWPEDYVDDENEIYNVSYTRPEDFDSQLETAIMAYKAEHTILSDDGYAIIKDGESYYALDENGERLEITDELEIARINAESWNGKLFANETINIQTPMDTNVSASLEAPTTGMLEKGALRTGFAEKTGEEFTDDTPSVVHDPSTLTDPPNKTVEADLGLSGHTL